MSAFNVGKKVSAAVRILQRKRDASARATHLMAKKDPLITYEKALLGQATGGKFPSVTFIERKQMSTKTSIKRIALVAAAALTLGGFSAVSANATAATGTVSKYSANKVTTTATTLTYGTTTNNNIVAGASAFASTDVGRGIWTDKYGFIGTIATYTDSVTVSLAAAPSVAGGARVDFAGSETIGSGHWYLGTQATVVATGITSGTINGQTVTAGTSDLLNIKFDTTAGGTEKAKLTYGGQTLSGSIILDSATPGSNGLLPFTAPLTAGTYAATLTIAPSGTYGTAADTTLTFTLTVTAASTSSPALSTAFMSAPLAAADAATSSTNAVARSGAKAVSTPLAQVQVTLLKADGTADTTGATVSASISGSGFVDVNVNAGLPGSALTRTAKDTTAVSKHYVHINADGTAGTGTVTVSVTDATTLVTTVLGTFTVTSYSSVAKLAIADSNYAIGKAGYSTGAAVTARTAAGEILGPLDVSATVPAFTVKASDSAGNLVNLTTNGAASVPTIVSSDTTVITGGTCVLDDGSSTTYSTGAGVGYYNCNFATSANAASGSKATLTVRTLDPADTAGVAYLTATYAVTVGAKVATTTLTTDASAYTPGQAMLVTFTAKDAKGNPVYDGASSPSLTTNKALGGAAGFNGWYVGGVDSSASSLAKSKYYAPVIAGDFLLTATDSTLAIITKTASVTDDAASGSASLALDAANAATDAANNAYDEAQNATQAASDALAAVTALSAQVSALIATVKSLAAMVAKIKAKVKA